MTLAQLEAELVHLVGEYEATDRQDEQLRYTIRKQRAA